jgi:hypothetical protein
MPGLFQMIFPPPINLQIEKGMNNVSKEAIEHQIAKAIAELFATHSMMGTTSANKVVFHNELVSIETYVLIRKPVEEKYTIQLDVHIYFGLDPIVESFSGLGNDVASAAFNAFETFKNNTFYTVLSSFFTTAFDQNVRKHNWKIDGKNFEVVTSNIGIKGKIPPNFSTTWLKQFEAEVQKLTLGEGTHWIRLFYAQWNNETKVCEVLLNNEPCLALQQNAKHFDWHHHQDYYTVRVFMILKNGLDFERVARIVVTEENEEAASQRLQKMGLSELEVDKAFAFIPEVFGRKLIQSMGVKGTFPIKARVINAAKEEFAINLNKEEIYTKADDLVAKLTRGGWSNDLKQIAFTSSAFNTLNRALHDGAELARVDCSNFMIGFYIPTYSGNATDKEKKPFWKFW